MSQKSVQHAIWVSFSLKLLEFKGLIDGRYFEAINSCCVRVVIRKKRLSNNIILVFEGPFYDFPQLPNQDYSLKRNLHLFNWWCLFHRIFCLINLWRFSWYMARLFVYQTFHPIHYFIYSIILILNIFG